MGAVPKHNRSALNRDPIEVISEVVMKISGVQLGDRQRSMVESRLQKRILELGLKGADDYLGYFDQNKEQEVPVLISLLTTHHTYFFREYSHFEYLEQYGIKAAADAARARGDNRIRIWSAACSRGQEVYSLSMFFQQNLQRIAPDIGFEIFGTDIDPESIAVAQNGVYHRNEIKEVPLQYISGNWAKGTGEISEFVKAKPSIKSNCHFGVMNLLKLRGQPNIKDVFQQKADIIFCRNVFIYFTQEQVRETVESLIENLTPEGILFIGISESLTGMGLPLNAKGPSIYVRQPISKPNVKTNKILERQAPVPAAEQQPMGLLRVLCVDDSPSVLTLLKQILKKEHGFEVVATACNGIDAAEKLKTVTVDVITLDIHMPEQTGLEYLQKNMRSSHPPVVMISSVSRENADLAMKCLEAGATDYVEKPALANLKERGDEIRTKLTCAHRNRQNSAKVSLSLDTSFTQLPEIKNPGDCFRLVIAGLSDRKKLSYFFRELKGPQPPTLVLMEGCETALQSFAQDASILKNGKMIFIENDISDLQPGSVSIADFSKLFDLAKGKYSPKITSVLVFGRVSKGSSEKIASWPNAHILLEDVGKVVESSTLLACSADTAPITSFAYCSVEFLSKANAK